MQLYRNHVYNDYFILLICSSHLKELHNFLTTNYIHQIIFQIIHLFLDNLLYLCHTQLISINIIKFILVIKHFLLPIFTNLKSTLIYLLPSQIFLLYIYQHPKIQSFSIQNLFYIHYIHFSIYPINFSITHFLSLYYYIQW